MNKDDLDVCFLDDQEEKAYVEFDPKDVFGHGEKQFTLARRKSKWVMMDHAGFFWGYFEDRRCAMGFAFYHYLTCHHFSIDTPTVEKSLRLLTKTKRKKWFWPW